jgi:outer membrane receptor for monomeric catechols
MPGRGRGPDPREQHPEAPHGHEHAHHSPDPDPADHYTGRDHARQPRSGDVTAKSAAVYCVRHRDARAEWELTGGLRYDDFDADGVPTVPAPVSEVDEHAQLPRGRWSTSRGRAAASTPPTGTSLNPSLEGLSYNTANTAIEPEKTYTARSAASGTSWARA